MRRFIIPGLILFVLMLLTVKEAKPLYNHPAQSEQLVIKSAQAESVYHYFTDFERSVRTTRIYKLKGGGFFPPPLDWTSPKEGRIVTSKGEGRWHKGQSARRML